MTFWLNTDSEKKHHEVKITYESSIFLPEYLPTPQRRSSNVGQDTNYPN
jgi:hypothetical protein